jgi:uncharacterized RDD family membrane protein YckC
VSDAGVMRRGLACPLDHVVVAFAWLLGTAWLVIVYGSSERVPLALEPLGLLVACSMVLAVVLDAVYFVGFVGACGQTPAKMLVGVRVVGRDGARVGYGRALVRWLGYALGIVTLGLGFLIAVLDGHRRALHDWIAGTRVVRV